MAVEIERKYWLANDHWENLTRGRGEQIVQGYFTQAGGIVAHLVEENNLSSVVIELREDGTPQPDLMIPVTAGVAAALAEQEVDDDGRLLIRSGFEARFRLSSVHGPTVTLKQGKAPMRTEIEFPVEREVALALMDPERGRVIGQTVEKTRHIVPWHNGVKIEIDVYEGRLDGLVVAEVEVPSLETWVALPDFIGPEITDGSMSNAKLALDPSLVGRSIV